MWYVSVFDTKESASRADLNHERAEWIRKEMDRTLKSRCRTVKRYEVLGNSPQKMFLVVESDDPAHVESVVRTFWRHLAFRDISRNRP